MAMVRNFIFLDVELHPENWFDAIHKLAEFIQSNLAVVDEGEINECTLY
jgi:hypothetical protein